MFFLYLLLFVLPFAYSQTHQCTFYAKVRKGNNRYSSCLWQTTRHDIALCLLQLKSLEKTMMCADWGENEALYFDLSDGSVTNRRLNKDLDLLPYKDKHGVTRWRGENDGRLRFTPRGLILAASYACAELGLCSNRLFAQVMMCPYEDMRQFIPCLKCKGVTPNDMAEFQSYINDINWGNTLYDLPTGSMTWDGERTCCHDGQGRALRLFGKEPKAICILKRRDAEDTSDYYTFTMTDVYTSTSVALSEAGLDKPAATRTAIDIDDKVESVTTDIAAGTTTIQQESSSPTESAKSGTGRQFSVDNSVFISTAITLFLMLG